MTAPLVVLAGPQALEAVRDEGLDLTRVSGLVGASGGPKWLALHGIDRVLFPRLRAVRSEPLHAVASSIGAWRFACLAQDDPAAAIDRFTHAYMEQRYPPRASPAVVSETSRQILRHVLGDSGTSALVEHPWLRLHVVTTRAKHLLALRGVAHALGLGVAGLLNALSRRSLGLLLERVVFDSQGDAGHIRWADIPTRHVALCPENAEAALLATASVPLLLEGVLHPFGAPTGLYMDGGICDYHFGPEIDPEDGWVLYPHFYAHLTPGWFDKSLRWRRTKALKRTIIVAPSPQFVAALPFGKIPDRNDFKRLDDTTRVKAWRSVVAAGDRIADAFSELLEGGRLRQVAAPLV